MSTLEDFSVPTKLSVNSSEMKIMLVKSQNKDKPCIMRHLKPWKDLNTSVVKLPQIIDGKNMLTHASRKEILLCI